MTGRRAMTMLAVSGGGLALIAWIAPHTVLVCAGVFVAILAVVGWPRRDPESLEVRSTRGDAATTWPGRGMKAIVESIREPAFIVDRAAMLRYRNPAAAVAFGNMALGDPLSLRFRQPTLIEAVESAIAAREARSATLDERRPFERTWRVEILPVAAAQGEAPRFFLLLFHDRTQEVRVERMRTDFIANASHELRTPLASVMGFIETLQGPARDDPVARDRFLAIMREQAMRMSRLINDLLSLSRIEMNRHAPADASCDLVAVMQSVAFQMAPVAREQGVVIDVEAMASTGPVFVRGEEDELIQVFSNLVENACKYASAGGRVELEVARVQEHGKAWVDGRVRDHGEGIAEEHLPRLTERFYRVNVDSSRAKQGTGLGLAIARNVLVRYGGRLMVESRLGEGSTFTARLAESRQKSKETEKTDIKQEDKLSY